LHFDFGRQEVPLFCDLQKVWSKFDALRASGPVGLFCELAPRDLQLLRQALPING
jgi:hypothetical protein